MQDGKRCPRCGEVKDRCEFPSAQSRPDGLFPYCRDCRRSYDREKRNGDLDRYRSYQRRYYAADRDSRKARVARRYEAKKTEIAEYRRRWAEANPDSHRDARRRWNKRNADACREFVRVRRARRKGARTIAFSADQLQQRAQMFGERCWMCRGQYDAFDHVKPLAKGGWHALSNLRPICTPCNTKKRDRWPLEKVAQ